MRDYSQGIFGGRSVSVGDSDQALNEVKEWIEAYCKRNGSTPAEFFEKVIRRGIDEVVDGPRTGRWSVAQLEKTEKTYIGTKMEIVTRSAFGLEPCKPLDFVIQGHPVDVKWSLTSQWAIPTEAVGQIVLVIGTEKTLARFGVGLVRCLAERLSKGENKDHKRTLSTIGRGNIEWIARDERLSPNFIEALDADLRERILAERSAQARIRTFAQLVVHRSFPRYVIETLCANQDPTRRTRKDGINKLGGMVILSGKPIKNRRILESLGYSCGVNEWISLYEDEVAMLLQER
jgi:hypothetical protein